MTDTAPPEHYRSLFLSDLHLGARGCKADQIAEFLRQTTADTIYLVGDILDLWHPLRPHWGPAQDMVVGLLRAQAERGARLVYLPGNHDAALRVHHGTTLMQVEIAPEAVHAAADGRRYLVLHGDVADARLLRFHVMTRIGSRADGVLRGLDAALRRLRRRALGPDERTMIEIALTWVTRALGMGRTGERRLAAMARARGLDGVICGHFHKPGLRDIDGVTYANCGDWVDSFCAVVETRSGALRLVWARQPDPGLAADRAPVRPQPDTATAEALAP